MSEKNSISSWKSALANTPNASSYMHYSIYYYYTTCIIILCITNVWLLNNHGWGDMVTHYYLFEYKEVQGEVQGFSAAHLIVAHWHIKCAYIYPTGNNVTLEEIVPRFAVWTDSEKLYNKTLSPRNLNLAYLLYIILYSLRLGAIYHHKCDSSTWIIHLSFKYVILINKTVTVTSWE